jgi:hypothetical protein
MGDLILVCVVLVVVALAPIQVTAQEPEPAPPHASVVPLPPAWSTWTGALQTPPPAAVARSLAFRAEVDRSFQAQESRSATRTILTASLVGAGAGLLVGLLVSGADLADDHSTVILTWTAAGLTAGVIGGLITWLSEPGG